MSEHTPTPWDLCRHLESAEKDAACQCGYRGGIWGNNGSLLVCEMRNCDQHEGHDMIPVGDRATQLADAAFIVKAVNSHDALVAALERITIVCTQHMDRDCNHRMALDGVRQIANDALDVETANNSDTALMKVAEAAKRVINQWPRASLHHQPMVDELVNLRDALAHVSRSGDGK